MPHNAMLSFIRENKLAVKNTIHVLLLPGVIIKDAANSYSPSLAGVLRSMTQICN
jgi:hypothetical protein